MIMNQKIDEEHCNIEKQDWYLIENESQHHTLTNIGTGEELHGVAIFGSKMISEFDENIDSKRNHSVQSVPMLHVEMVGNLLYDQVN